MSPETITIGETVTALVAAGFPTWSASDITLRLRPNLTWSATRGDNAAYGSTAQEAADSLLAAEHKIQQAAKLAARSTQGQNFAREMRRHLHIGARTRRFDNKKWTKDGHHDVMQAIADANNCPGSINAAREAIFHTAFPALCSWDKHIAGYRADSVLVSHINNMTPYQFTDLIGDLIDAGITNVGEGEAFFAEMARRLHAQAA